MAGNTRILNSHDGDTARLALAALHDRAGEAECFVGFDGFVDSIIDVVAQRHAPGAGGYDRMASLQEFATLSGNAAGKSANVELVVTEQRAGGNGPIMAGALAHLGARVHCTAALDHPVFETLRSACASCVCLGEPGATDALEFDDGKLMLGKTAQMDRITWDRVVDASGGIDAIIASCNATRIIAPLGWTMIPAMNAIWSGMAKDVLPHLDEPGEHEVFIDWSDPAKRTDDELDEAFAILRTINAILPVTMGCNVAEAERFSRVLPRHQDERHDGTQSAASFAHILSLRTGLYRVAVHEQHLAAVAEPVGCWIASTDYTPEPLTCTGAGDHFNAGLCFALAHGCATPTALLTAIAVSGLFVRTGQHPALDDVIEFLESFPAE